MLELFIDEVRVTRQYRGRPRPSPEPHVFLRLRLISALLGATRTSSRILRRDREFVFAASATRKSHFLKSSTKTPSVRCLRRNDQDKHGFRSPKSVIQVKQTQDDACSPFQASYGACRIESHRIHVEACSRADCIPVRRFVFAETCGRLAN